MPAAYPRRSCRGKAGATSPVKRFMVNVGTEPSPTVIGAARCPLWGLARDGASVVVRERESRLHGEGRQQVAQWGTGKTGGRR